MTARQRHRRYRLAGPGHAPAAPRESRRRIEQIPVGTDLFSWRPGEVAYGPAPRLASMMLRLQALYGRSPPEGDDE
jgi:hypothetical protein